jgi:hypothetical protein
MQYLQEIPTPGLILRNLRKSLRHQPGQLIAITAKGTGKIIDISLDGLSFGCLYPHNFPREMKIDILGADGVFIKGIGVETRWENSYSPAQRADNFEKVTGLCFTGLDHLQSAELEKIIGKFEDTAPAIVQYC